MPSRGDDESHPRLAVAALAVLAAMGQASSEPAAFVTAPQQLTRVHRSDPRTVSVSADGRFVAFVSSARLVPADTNDRLDIYVLDRTTGAVSVETAGSPIATEATPVINANGRFLVYEAPDERSPQAQILMLRDRQSGVTRPLQSPGVRPNGYSRGASISADGRYVAFTSTATNLVEAPDANGEADDVYVVDVTTMTCRRVTGGPPDAQPPIARFAPALSADGRYVAFSATAPSDPAAGGAQAPVVYLLVQDLRTGATSQASVGFDGAEPDGSSYGAAMSADGRYVAFVSLATNLVRRRDRNTAPDVYLRDMGANATTLISRTPSGGPGNGPSDHPMLSADGRVVVFQSDASDLTCGRRCPTAERDINLVSDVFRYDARTGQIECVSRGRTPWMEASLGPAMDAAGSVIAFASRHPRDAADDGHDYDLFVWARETRPESYAFRDSAR